MLWMEETIEVMSDEQLIIPFPSLVQKVGSERVREIRTIAERHNCILKRFRRSRNWQLSGERSHLSELLKVLGGLYQTEDFVLVKLHQYLNCNDKTGQGSRLLHEMIRSDPGLTAAELMEKTGCTLVEVRLARTEYEDF